MIEYKKYEYTGFAGPITLLCEFIDTKLGSVYMKIGPRPLCEPFDLMINQWVKDSTGWAELLQHKKHLTEVPFDKKDLEEIFVDLL